MIYLLGLPIVHCQRLQQDPYLNCCIFSWKLMARPSMGIGFAVSQFPREKYPIYQVGSRWVLSIEGINSCRRVRCNDLQCLLDVLGKPEQLSTGTCDQPKAHHATAHTAHQLYLMESATLTVLQPVKNASFSVILGYQPLFVYTLWPTWETSMIGCFINIDNQQSVARNQLSLSYASWMNRDQPTRVEWLCLCLPLQAIITLLGDCDSWRLRGYTPITWRL